MSSPLKFKKRPVGAIFRLPARNVDQVKRWLTEEHLTYREVQARLVERFNLRVSHNAVWNFYRRFCAGVERGAEAPAAAPGVEVTPASNVTEILVRIRLEVVPATAPAQPGARKKVIRCKARVS